MGWTIVNAERLPAEDHGYRIEAYLRGEKSAYATVRMSWKADAGQQTLSSFHVSRCQNHALEQWLWDSPDDRADEIDAVLGAPADLYAYRLALAGAGHKELADFGSRELEHVMSLLSESDPIAHATLRKAWAFAKADEEQAQEEASALGYGSAVTE